MLSFVCVAVIGGTGTTAKAKSKVKLNTKSITMEVGSSKKLTLKKAKAKKVKWSTSNKNIARVVKGKVTAKASGSCKVVAKYQGKKYTCKVTVKAKGKEVEEETTEQATTEKKQDKKKTTEEKQGKKKTTEQPSVDLSKYIVTTKVLDPDINYDEKLAEYNAKEQAFKETHGEQDWKIMFSDISAYEYSDDCSDLDLLSAANLWYHHFPYGEWNNGCTWDTLWFDPSYDYVFESNYHYSCWACKGVASMMESLGYKTCILHCGVYDNTGKFTGNSYNNYYTKAEGVAGHVGALVFIDSEHYVWVETNGYMWGDGSTIDPLPKSFTKRDKNYYVITEYDDYVERRRGNRDLAHQLHSVYEKVDWLRDYDTVYDMMKVDFGYELSDLAPTKDTSELVNAYADKTIYSSGETNRLYKDFKGWEEILDSWKKEQAELLEKGEIVTVSPY